MVSSTIAREYTRQRKLGNRAKDAFYAARINAEWKELDGVEMSRYDNFDDSQDSLVRILIEDDDNPEFAMDFSCENPNCQYESSSTRTMRSSFTCQIHEKEAKRIERDGVCGIVGQYRTSLESKWQTVDSVWGFVGDDWRDSGYDVDIKKSVMDALKHFSGC